MRLMLPFAAVLLTGSIGAAWAQDRPLISPSRDVTITYKVLGREGVPPMQMSHGAASGLMRVDMTEMGGYAIIDRKRKMSTMVMVPMRMFMEISAAADPKGQSQIGPGSMPEDNATFTRKGTDTVAGESCVVWDVASPAGDGVACVTADGAMLRYRTKAGEGLEATKVAYGTLPADRFTVPAGFQKMDMPAMGGGGAGMGAPGMGAPGMGTPRPR